MVAGNEKDVDQIYLYAAHQVKGIQPLLRSFFGFLERKTDFYEASTEAAQHMVLMVFQEFCEVHKQKKKQAAEKCVPIPHVEGATIEEVGTDESGTDTSSKTQGDINNSENQDDADTDKSADNDHEDHGIVFFEESKRTKKGSVYPNDGDGATYKHYKWTQTPTELEIVVPLCKHQQELSSTLQVSYTSTSVFAYIEKKELLGGCLADSIKPGEVTWTLEDKVLYIRAEKVKRSWWRQLLITEPMLLLKPILRKHASVSDICEEEMREFQQTVVNKRDYTIAKHNEQFPDKIPIPENFEG